MNIMVFRASFSTGPRLWTRRRAVPMSPDFQYVIYLNQKHILLSCLRHRIPSCNHRHHCVLLSRKMDFSGCKMDVESQRNATIKVLPF